MKSGNIYYSACLKQTEKMLNFLIKRALRKPERSPKIILESKESKQNQIIWLTPSIGILAAKSVTRRFLFIR